MSRFDFDSPEFKAAAMSKAVVFVLGLLILIFFFSSYSVISPGNTGVIFNIWTGSLRTVPQGIAWRIPFITQVQSYPTALRTYTMVRRQGKDRRKATTASTCRRAKDSTFDRTSPSPTTPQKN